MIKRQPVVAGRFYPGDTRKLGDEVRRLASGGPREKAVAIIAPHAGYMYSGSVAGHIYSSIEIPDTVIVIGPNHTGLGKRVALMTGGAWVTPLGTVEVDAAFADALLRSSRLITADRQAHESEHSIEVQLPFIQSINKDALIVPLTVMNASAKECLELGKAIADTIKELGRGALIVASSDMNHYESDAVTRRKDKEAIAEILKLDGDGLLAVTSQKEITMCGVIPAAIAINAAKLLGARSARVVDYATSGDVNKDYAQVVGYAGILIK